MSPPDRAPEVAAFLLAGEQPLGGYEKVVGDLCGRWPGLTRGEAIRGFDIALELGEVEILELQAGIAAFESARNYSISAASIDEHRPRTRASENRQHP